MVTRSTQGALLEVDRFEDVLQLAGLGNVSELPPREAPLTPEDAAALHDALLNKPVTLGNFGPRLVASYLLSEVMEEEQELPRAELLQRMERFKNLAVLRPDGYLAWALSGRTQQRVGPVEWEDGAFRARAFELGRFYSGRTAAFFPVDEHLRPLWKQGPLAEVYDDADVISRVMDGAEESFVELGLTIGHLVAHPIDSAAQLRQLPQSLASLVANSPQYLERFRWMTRGEQIEALSKLTTTLYSLYSAGAGATRTVAGLGRGAERLSVPALSLSAEGALVMERVAVPVGRTAAAVSGGPGAVIILQRANTAAKGGQPPDDLSPKRWFAYSGAKQLVEQAKRQFTAAGGVPIRWHVAEKKTADAIRELFKGESVKGIEVVHTPALQ